MAKRPEIFDELDRIAPLIPTPVYWLDTDYVIIGGNDLCLTAIGSKEKNINDVLIGKTYYDYYPKDIADELTKMVEIVLSTNQATKVEEKITDVSTGKFRYYETARAPLYDNKGNIVGTICSATEITDKKETERLTLENAKQKAELEAQNEFNRLVGQVYHDINTPLLSFTSLLGLLSQLPPITTVDGYKIALMSKPTRNKHTVYLEKTDAGLKYEVLGEKNTLNQGFFSWETILTELKDHFPKNNTDLNLFQKKCLPVLLNLIIKEKHTAQAQPEPRVPENLRIVFRNLLKKSRKIVNTLKKRGKNKDKNNPDEIQQNVLLSAFLILWRADKM